MNHRNPKDQRASINWARKVLKNKKDYVVAIDTDSVYVVLDDLAHALSGATYGFEGHSVGVVVARLADPGAPRDATESVVGCLSGRRVDWPVPGRDHPVGVLPAWAMVTRGAVEF